MGNCMTYRQNTIQSCLSTCLRYVSKIKKKEEDNILINGLKVTRNDFALGHLDYLSRKFGKKINYFVESKPFSKFLKRINRNKKIKITSKRIDLKFILKSLRKGLIIVYLDSYYLKNSRLSKVHTPHFVVVIKKQGDKLKILDPWDGKEKLVNEEVFMIAVRSLWDYLWYSTALIQIRN